MEWKPLSTYILKIYAPVEAVCTFLAAKYISMDFLCKYLATNPAELLPPQCFVVKTFVLAMYYGLKEVRSKNRKCRL